MHECVLLPSTDFIRVIHMNVFPSYFRGFYLDRVLCNNINKSVSRKDKNTHIYIYIVSIFTYTVDRIYTIRLLS